MVLFPFGLPLAGASGRKGGERSGGGDGFLGFGGESRGRGKLKCWSRGRRGIKSKDKSKATALPPDPHFSFPKPQN